jgi:predicted Zn-dependent protease with MMP-like domain
VLVYDLPGMGERVEHWDPIFRRPIYGVCGPDETRIREQIRRTVLHEVAHHFGISDERLHELGAY